MTRKLYALLCPIIIVLLALFDAFYIKPPLSTPTHIHKILYLDQNFDQQEVRDIVNAAKEWTDTTQHIAEFDVVQLPTNQIDLINGIIITKVTGKYPGIFLVDAMAPKGSLTLGFYNPLTIPIPTIELVSDRIKNQTHDVMLHELGHSVGLAHNPEPFTLMYPMLDWGVDYISLSDLEMFCKIYQCDPNQLNQ